MHEIYTGNQPKKSRKKSKKIFFEIFTTNHPQAKPYDRSFNYDQFYKFSSLICHFRECKHGFSQF